MSEPLYGHDLMSLVLARGGSLSVEELRTAALAAHGPNPTYHNCHGDSFDFDGVLAFLNSKGKIHLAGGQVSLGGAPACQH
jgi:probable metal-binding protein